MNNKEFIAELSKRMEMPSKDVSRIVAGMVENVSETLQNGDQVVVSSFGTFEVKKKLERIVVNPLSKQRMLVPPKLVVGFKPSTSLKDKYKNHGE